MSHNIKSIMMLTQSYTNTSLIFYRDPLSQSRSKYFYVLYSLYQSFKNSEFDKSAGSLLSSCCLHQHWPNLLPEEGGLEGFSKPGRKWSQLKVLIFKPSKLTSFDFCPRLRIRVDRQLWASDYLNFIIYWISSHRYFHLCPQTLNLPPFWPQTSFKS